LQLLFSILQGGEKLFNIKTAFFSSFPGKYFVFLKNLEGAAFHFGAGPFPGHFTYFGFFLQIELVYVKKAWKIEGLPSHRGRLR